MSKVSHIIPRILENKQEADAREQQNNEAIASPQMRTTARNMLNIILADAGKLYEDYL